MLGMMIGSGKELLHFFNVTRSPISAFYVAGLVARFVRDMIFHRRPMRLMNGNALVARLAKSCFDKGVQIWTALLSPNCFAAMMARCAALSSTRRKAA